MKIILTILAQPVYSVLFVWHKIQAAAVIGELAGWLVLALVYAAIVFAAARFVLDDVFSGAKSANEAYTVIGNFLWRLGVILMMYVGLSVLLYAFAGLVYLLAS